MRYLLFIFTLLFSTFCFSETIATCSPQIGDAFYANMGIVNKENSGWKVLPSNGTISLSKISKDNFDILFTDATKEIRSAVQEGAHVKILRNSNNEMAFLVSDPHNTAIEIYDFMRDKQGHNIVAIVTSEGGGDEPFYKSSVENGDSSFINFNE